LPAIRYHRTAVRQELGKDNEAFVVTPKEGTLLNPLGGKADRGFAIVADIERSKAFASPFPIRWTPVAGRQIQASRLKL
jgi:hypothetical protein